jgi:SAM-dependent methyltransferase
MALGRDLGFAVEMEWLEEILNWPASWSALHGIAQVKTPVLKVSTRTDATAHEFVVRRAGRRMPAEAAAGLVFPFRSPEGPGLTQTVAFVRGLEAPIAPYTAPPDWYASDNGFSSATAMDEAHRPIVELAHASIGDTGTVLDLGCGNGALLKKICEPRPNLIPFGADLDETKLEHARQLQPLFAANFVAGSMFDGIPLDSDTIYSLVLLMPGRLLEVDEASGRQLRSWLRGHFHHLLVYAYGEWLTRHGGLEGLAAKAGLRLVSQHASGAAGLAQIAD